MGKLMSKKQKSKTPGKTTLLKQDVQDNISYIITSI